MKKRTSEERIKLQEENKKGLADFYANKDKRAAERKAIFDKIQENAEAARIAAEEAAKPKEHGETVFVGEGAPEGEGEPIAPVLREGVESLQEATEDEGLPVMRSIDHMDFSEVGGETVFVGEYVPEGEDRSEG